MRIEQCQASLEALVEFASKQYQTRNEATTRLHLVDRLFFECLAWEKQDCIVEEGEGGNFADYTFSLEGRELIVEAKKEGRYFELPAGTTHGEMALPTLMNSNKELKSAISQVATYCQQRGVPLGVVCNGRQLVGFVAVRTDGKAPLDGSALIFPSLESMSSNFTDLWNSLSRFGISERRLHRRLLGATGIPLPPKLSAFIPGYPGVQTRNIFQNDLQIVSELVLEDLVNSPRNEELFLKECYSKAGALSGYALVSKEILSARYQLADVPAGSPSLEPAVDKKSRVSPDLVADGLSRRPILLIGDVGVGKTSFIRNLIKAEAREILAKAITLYINFGTRASLTSSLREFLVDEVSRQLRDDYRIDSEEANVVRGIYHSELSRFRKGIWGGLAATDPDKFKEKEIDHLQTLIGSQDRHLAALIAHLVYGRKQQVVLFLDNVDQREYQTQQQAFLIAQEIADSWPVTVFLALRPETFYRSKRTGALTGYHPKAFTISPPRMDEVIVKRLEFALKIANGEARVDAINGNTQFKVKKLASVIQALRMSIERNESLIEAIDNVSAGNIRFGLDLVRDFLGSGHVDTEKIVDILDSTGTYFIPLHEFMRAVILGEYTHYDSARSPIANIFDVGKADSREHFLLPIILQAASSLSHQGTHGYVQRKNLVNYCQDLGYSIDQVILAVSRALEKGLISRGTSDAETEMEISLVVRLTPKGAYHVQRLMNKFFYSDLMIADTPILDAAFRGQILNVSTIAERLKRCEIFVDYLDLQWGRSGLPSEALAWPEIASQIREDIRQVQNRLNRY